MPTDAVLSFPGQTGETSERIPGSFRDPSGYVFSRRGRIFRAIDAACHETLRDLEASGSLGELLSDRTLVGSSFVDTPEQRLPLAAEHDGYEYFLEHDRVEPITYPYEWCVSMLADAALHTLTVQERLLAVGCSLKDASAFNIQFMNGRPTFIDLASIERPERLDVWFAMGQFQRMFTYPLLLFRHHGWDIRSYFLASLDGRDVEQVVRSLGLLQRWRPRNLLDVTLPLVLGRWANRATASPAQAPPRAHGDTSAQLLNLRRLRAKIGNLATGYKTGGVWSDYSSTCTYSDTSEEAKKALVKEFLETARPQRVLDAGCNTGTYSYLAAACGARVLATDADHDAIELLYRRLRQEPAAITPLVLDLANPSPGIGFLNRERPSFLERVQVDCVLALALLHHLLVSANLSLPAVCDFFADLTSDYLILEFVPTTDPMFQRLLRFRRNLYDGLDLEQCRSVFSRRFTVLAERPIPDSPRTLLFLRKTN